MGMVSIRRRTLYICLTILGLFLLGTVIVLSSVSYYLSIDPNAYISESEVPILDNGTRWNASEHGQIERIPRILHQTWKSETLPTKWQNVSQGCRDMMPDYEYMLWTDAGSRDFIAEHYPWFLESFDDYTYPIQRADAIRYFVLHHYGGVYLDLDIGCLRPLDPLLIYPIILPKTIPVGVSNDLIFAEKGHPFMDQTIHNLISFDHSWILNYPTVMFSTGPMFLSAQYGLYVASHPDTPNELRILPKALYGKNAKPGEAPHSFFSHYYGSSWHADDAAFIGFLGKWGKGLMWIGLVILVIGLLRLAFTGHKQRKYGLRRIGNYDVLLPHWTQRSGRWHLDLGWLSLPTSGASDPMPSAVDGREGDLSDEENVSLLPMPFSDIGPESPAPSDDIDPFSLATGRQSHSILDAVRRAGNRARYLVGGARDPEASRRRRHRPGRGVLFFLPAFLTQSNEAEPVARSPTSLLPTAPFLRAASTSAQQLPPEKFTPDLEGGGGSFHDAFGDNYRQTSRSHARSRSQHPSRTNSPAPPLVDGDDIPDARNDA